MEGTHAPDATGAAHAHRTRPWAIIVILLCTIFTSVAQLFYKLASQRLPEIATNWPLFAGAICYILAAGLMMLAFKGGEVTVLYPLIATSYIWVTLIAAFVFGESIGVFKIAGLVLIFIGITGIALASRHAEVPL